jgi:hypothetical protein
MNGVLTFSQWAKSVILNESVKDAKIYLIKKYAERNRIDEMTPEDEKKALDNKSYHQIREIVGNNEGYVFPFVKFHFEQRIPISSEDPGTVTIKSLYDKLKTYAGSLNQLPMTLQQYANTPTVNGVSGAEAMSDAIDRIQIKKKLKWVISDVNAELRQGIRQFSEEELDRLYDAAAVIDKADEENNIDLSKKEDREKSKRLGILKKSSAFTDATYFLRQMEATAEGLMNRDIGQKINEIEAISPEAGLIYAGDGYLVISVRTQNAQDELFKIVSNTWCLNYAKRHNQYGGQAGHLQYNIFNFNLPVSEQLFITGHTLDPKNKVVTSHRMDDGRITQSSNFEEHLRLLGYPEKLISYTIASTEKERLIKTAVENFKIEAKDPLDSVKTIVRQSYQSDISQDIDTVNVLIGIIKDEVLPRINRKGVLDSYLDFGVLSTFSAKVLNTLIPDLTDDEVTAILNKNDEVFELFKRVLATDGRSKRPFVAAALESADEIREILLNGTTTTTT